MLSSANIAASVAIRILLIASQLLNAHGLIWEGRERDVRHSLFPISRRVTRLRSGRSGVGKTQNTKKVIEFLSAIATDAHALSSSSSHSYFPTTVKSDLRLRRPFDWPSAE